MWLSGALQRYPDVLTLSSIQCTAAPSRQARGHGPCVQALGMGFHRRRKSGAAPCYRSRCRMGSTAYAALALLRIGSHQVGASHVRQYPRTRCSSPGQAPAVAPGRANGRWLAVHRRSRVRRCSAPTKQVLLCL